MATATATKTNPLSSQTPYEAAKYHTKSADRSLRRHRNTLSVRPDTIDKLDNIGDGFGSYHHDGPYDACLASRNRNPRYAPLAAVKYGNAEALRATPREQVLDSLRKHVPLQGTAVIPPGEYDFTGNRKMRYREGADLMREKDAPGGAYKRWDHMTYHPDDLKGKGEPSFTIDRDQKESRKRLDRVLRPSSSPSTSSSSRRNNNNDDDRGSYELMDRQRRSGSGKQQQRHQRSASNPFADPNTNNAKPTPTVGVSSGTADADTEGGVGGMMMHRRHSTTGGGGGRFDGLKRRWGSLRRKL